MVALPAVRVTSAGPMATVSVPASTTSALIVPAARSAMASFGLVRSANATSPLARTSTAGAAAVCRTTRRPSPAAIGAVSLTNGVMVGVPSAVRCATSVTFAPAGTVALAVITGSPVPSVSDAGNTVIS